MATLNSHHKPVAGAIGKCSVPLFGASGPAGFCLRDAYGQQYHGSLSEFYGNRATPLAMGLCCKAHGGAGEDDIRVMRDGDAWMAFRPGFENLQESTAGFGQTQDLALAELLRAEAA